MRMNIIDAISEKIDNFKYRNYKRLNVTGFSKRLVIDENTINECDLILDFLIIKNQVKFINRGTLSGVIIFVNTKFRNEGIIKGVVQCVNGIYYGAKKSQLIGDLGFDKLIVQPGCIIDGHVYRYDDYNFFSNSVKKHFSESLAIEAMNLLQNLDKHELNKL